VRIIREANGGFVGEAVGAGRAVGELAGAGAGRAVGVVVGRAVEVEGADLELGQRWSPAPPDESAGLR